MAWLSTAWKALMALPQVLKTIQGLSAFIKKLIQDQKIKKAKESVDETVSTGDQRSEEKAIGSDSGVPLSDPTGGLQERPKGTRN